MGKGEGVPKRKHMTNDKSEKGALIRGGSQVHWGGGGFGSQCEQWTKVQERPCIAFMHQFSGAHDTLTLPIKIPSYTVSFPSQTYDIELRGSNSVVSILFLFYVGAPTSFLTFVLFRFRQKFPGLNRVSPSPFLFWVKLAFTFNSYKLPLNLFFFKFFLKELGEILHLVQSIQKFILLLKI